MESDVLKRKVGELEVLGDCPVCLEQKLDNRVLVPCGHSICLDCLERILPPNSQNKCPECKQIFTVFPKAADFMKDYRKNSLVSFLQKEPQQKHHKPEKTEDYERTKTSFQADLDETILVLQAKKRETKSAAQVQLKQVDTYFDQVIQQATQARERIKQSLIASAHEFTINEKKLGEAIENCKSLQRMIESTPLTLWSKFGPTIEESVKQSKKVETTPIEHEVFLCSPNILQFGHYEMKEFIPLGKEELLKKDLESLAKDLSTGTLQQKCEAITALKSYTIQCSHPIIIDTFRQRNRKRTFHLHH